MKRLLLIILTICLVLCACTPSDHDESSSQSAESSSQESESSSSEFSSSSSSESEQESSVDENKAYLDIERFEPKGYDINHFAITDSNYALSAQMPREWSFIKSGSQYKIMRAGNQIGSILSGKISDDDKWIIISSKEKQRTNVTLEELVEKKGTGESIEYRYRWRYSYVENNTDKEINVVVTCAETPTLSSYRMVTLAMFNEIQGDPNFGTIGVLDAPKILVVGNSFVGTSGVGDFLREMLIANDKGGDVYSISIGMGNIGKYATDDRVMLEIEQGGYDLVVMSGFYGSDDSASLETIKNACDDASSILVALPAHNENIDSARKASKKCGVECIEWKTEIDDFIAGGVDKWSLCYNDSYYHSTPHAGYIGAHMIYRAIYSECPTMPLETPLTQNEIDSVLGDYAETGSVRAVDTSLIKYLG